MLNTSDCLIARDGPAVCIRHTRNRILTTIYDVNCFSLNLARVITSSAAVASEMEKYECLPLVEIYRMTR